MYAKRFICGPTVPTFAQVACFVMRLEAQAQCLCYYIGLGILNQLYSSVNKSVISFVFLEQCGNLNGQDGKERYF